jgi:hypothetical protein
MQGVFNMFDISELFWSSSIDEIMKGYRYLDDQAQYICMICGKTYEKGIIYTEQGMMMEAEKAAQFHINNDHEGMFDYLLQMNKKYTGLTEHQQTLLKYFNEGYSDKEIVQLLGGGSTSTIRNHRFNLKEREKQAKVFLAIMSLLNNKEDGANKLLNVHRSATMIDERYAITEKERDEVISRYFIDERLSKLPSKEKRKLIVLQHIMRKIEPERKYSEKEINMIIENIFSDYVTIRRYLIQYGFMDRTSDGSSYWVKK